ncbi:dihydrofolate reductase [Marinimicrobium sp. C2-29]|uniref:dihydrofolate reductase n=1 Tax=Marinimicrobium sp. C2-29 TaxID=3139825 RepID=UPI003138D720
MKVAIIVATARNGVIGRDNQLPWRLPDDLKHFKAVTLGKPVIMGRKTHESIGRALPGRLNIVISRSPRPLEDPAVRWVSSLEEGLALARAEQPDAEELMVMGGAEIYRQALAQTDRIYLTRIDLEIEGDAYFPELSPAEWTLTDKKAGASDAPVPHSFLEYEKVTA